MPRSATHFRGFTLIELLVVISIIALLIGILLPALGSARNEARAIKCASNARQVMIAMEGYVSDSKGFYPPSYVYASPGDQWSGSGNSGVSWDWSYQNDANSDPTGGYIHWTYQLFSNGSVKEEAFECPQMEFGGMPATNPHDDAKMPGQTNGAGAGVDRQARWTAYTGNESIMPRNKFNSGNNRQRLTRASDVLRTSATISVTEFMDSYASISDTNGICKSHRPIQPFWNPQAGANDATQFVPVNIGGVLTSFIACYDWGQPFGTNGGVLVSLTAAKGAGQIDGVPINAVGRHHPGGSSGTIGGEGTANFAYVDGHVKRMTVRESLIEEQWGDKFYSLQTQLKVRNDLSNP